MSENREAFEYRLEIPGGYIEIRKNHYSNNRLKAYVRLDKETYSIDLKQEMQMTKNISAALVYLAKEAYEILKVIEQIRVDEAGRTST